MKNFFTFLVVLTSFWQSFYEAQVCQSLSVTDAVGNSDVLVDCNYPLVNNNRCLTLNASAPTTRATDTYSVSSTAYSPYIPYNSGTALNADYDDLFASSIDIPFTFCFFGKYYNKVVVGSNGLITFDLSQLNKISFPNIAHNNPHPLLPGNSIFGVYQDLTFPASEPSEIYYSVIGTGFCRKLVINFYQGRLVGCDERVSTQIVLSEFTNEIEIFVEDKKLPCSTARFSNSLLGIMNEDGTLGYSPTNRNTGVWAAQNEGWKFSPNGAVIGPVIDWFDVNNFYLGTGNSISVCPENNTTYRARATYNICGAPQVFTDDINVNFAPDYPLAKNFTKTFCITSGASESINLDDYQQNVTPQNVGNFNFTYHNSATDAGAGNNPIGANVSINSNTTYFVRIQNKTNPNCFLVAELRFEFISNVLLGTTVNLCDSNNDGIENNYQLWKFNNQLFSSGAAATISYYTNSTDANSSTNPISVANITATTQLWVRYTNAFCSMVFGPISVSFTPGPAVNTPINFAVTTCDFNDDLQEPFDFSTEFDSLVTSETRVTISYYSTFQEAYDGYGYSLSTIHNGQYSVFARVAYPGGCFSIAEIKLDVTFTNVPATAKTIAICFNGTDNVTVDLAVLSQTMYDSTMPGITVTFYKSQNDAEIPQNAISPSQVITDDGYQVYKTFYVRFERADHCYTVRPLTISLIHPVAMKTDFSACDTGNNGSESVNLTDYSWQIAGSQTATISYFLSNADAVSGANPQTNILLLGTQTYYVKVQVESCVEIYTITIKLVAAPNVIFNNDFTANNICDNNNDGQEPFDITQYESSIYNNTASVYFSYYRNYDPSSQSLNNPIYNPQSYLASANNTVYVKVQFTASGCFSIVALNLKINFLPTIILSEATLRRCDPSFDFNESFNLNEATSTMFDQSQNSVQLSDTKITYYKTLAKANAGLVSSQIPSSQTTDNALTTIYARFESLLTGCFSVQAIHLKTYFPPKAINSVISGICDSNLNGKYEVNLLNYTSKMVDFFDPENHFKFYLNETDAQNDQNEITNPPNFEIATLPARIWVKVENVPGCNDLAFIDLQAGAKVVLANSGPFTLESCDAGNDGSEVVDLTQFEAQMLAGGTFTYYPSLADLNNNTNAITNPKAFLFKIGPGENRIYVKVDSAGFCPEMTIINVRFKVTPFFSIPDHYFCPYDGDSVDIKPNFSGLNLVSYEWKNPAGEVVSTDSELLGVNVAGTYFITVTAANGCSFTTTFEVKNYEVPIITQLVPNDNSFTVIATGSKPILYSIDGINWQTSNVFVNLPKGVTNFYVKFENEECRGLPKKGVVLDIPNVFTPNEDGINDFWTIKGLDVFEGQQSSIQVFDRQQIMVFEQKSADQFVWNGKWIGRTVPTTTYWYVITLPDGRLYKGWVVVKNRN